MNWTEDDYVKRAAELAQHSAAAKIPLNDACQKVAEEEGLNPEEIRTLVRLSNVAMFQHLFKEKDANGAPDRHVDFDVGDPETVIQRLQQSAAEPPQSANIMNDKLSHEIPDLMGAKRRGFELDNDTVKVGSDYEVKPARRDQAVMTMRKLAEEFDIRRISAGFRWEEKIAQLVGVFKKAPGYGPDFQEFEKDAFAEFGPDIAVELSDLRNDLRLGGIAVAPEEQSKLAEHRVVDDSSSLKLLKEALDARTDYVACERGKAWVEKNMPSLES